MTLHTDLAQWIVRRAAHVAPALLAERLEEEWLADLATRSRAVSRLRFALGCAWATRVIAREHVAAGMAATAVAPAAAGQPGAALRAVAIGGGRGRAPRSGRVTALLVIVCLHVALIYVLASGLSHTAAVTLLPNMLGTTIDAPHTPHDTPPPLPSPTFTPPPIDIPSSDIPLGLADSADPIQPVISDPTPEVASNTPPTQHIAHRVVGGPGRGFPDTDDFYPATARRAGEVGLSTMQVCVDGKGRLTADPKVTQSSGSARLDDGALKLARAGSGHYTPTTEDGRAVDSCYAFRIRFQLKD